MKIPEKVLFLSDEYHSGLKNKMVFIGMLSSVISFLKT
jgi:hypothetical protein